MSDYKIPTGFAGVAPKEITIDNLHCENGAERDAAAPASETPLITQKQWNAKLRELRVLREELSALGAEGKAQEPVAWMYRWKKDGELYGIYENRIMDSFEERNCTIEPLYAAPAKPAAQEPGLHIYLAHDEAMRVEGMRDARMFLDKHYPSAARCLSEEITRRQNNDV